MLRLARRLRERIPPCLMPRLGVISLAFLLLFSPRVVNAQAVTGTILGTVSDSSGAVMPGVTVAVTQTETGLSRSFVTD